ncbi:hypothetical protein ONZ45_g10651 [Pleurotus djamor]|nr:hypothetical protein ONZ45_g11813 [Pleurotus djamor]KAJ8506882.1 hypothetical protein ONZ45_g10651 [Pleurotus djamor]
MPWVANKSSHDINVWVAKDSDGNGSDSWYAIPTKSVETHAVNNWSRKETRKMTIKSNGKVAAFDVGPAHRVEVSDANIIIYQLVPVGNAMYFAE